MKLDHVCVILIISIIMFNAPKDMESRKEIKVAQDHFKLTLYRYLRSKMSTANAVVKMEDGSFRKAGATVKVTIGGCGG